MSESGDIGGRSFYRFLNRKFFSELGEAVRTDRQFRTFGLAGRRDRLPRRRREFRGGIRRPALLFPERRER